MRIYEEIYDFDELDLIDCYDLQDCIFEGKPFVMPKGISAAEKKELNKQILQLKCKYVRYIADTFVQKDTQPEPPLLREFLENFLPKVPGKFNIFVANKCGDYANIKADRQEHINLLCKLVNCPELSVYHYHTAFKRGKVADRASTAFNAITIDIDDVVFPFDIVTVEQQELQQYILDHFDFKDKPFPDAVSISSKKGLHLIFYHDTVNYADTERNELRQRVFDSMLCHLGGDKLTRNPCHMFRTPTSYHLKREPVRGRLFLFDNPGKKTLERLQPFMKTQEEIDLYFAECNRKTQEKRNNTRRENKIKKLMEKGYTREEAEYFLTHKKEKKTGNRKREEKAKKKNDEKLPIEPPSDDEDDNYHYDLDFSHLRYRKSRSYRPLPILLVDLHNFLVRNGNDCLYHNRQYFFFLLANYGKCVIKDVEEFLEYCTQYCPRDNAFFPELERTVRKNYAKEDCYHIEYERIAQQLGFTERDIRESRSCFDKSLKADKRKQSKHEYYERTKSHELPWSKMRKADCLEYIKENPEAKEAEICIIFGISRNTYYRYRRELQI